VIKNPATRIVAAVLFVSGVTVAPLLDNAATDDSSAGDAFPAQRPHFQIRWQQGELELSGHTSSQEHEQALRQVAESEYPGSRVTTNFQPLGIVPDYWAGSTAQVLFLLQASSSAEATLSTNELKIRSVIVDEPDWKKRLKALEETMPADMEVSADTILVDPTVSVPAICGRAFESFDSGRINFEESSVDFRPSAYPRLDRLIALANACQESQIAITGHTDASGNEAWNQLLSVRRASAVGDYVANGGISQNRLQISGVGSAEPVADDSTRYGRSLNRRIEIVLSGNY
jgi:outer membrane protein OmpA-like peptidoglycan-associated protein